MPELTIKLEAKDKTEARLILVRLGVIYPIKEAVFDGKKETFDISHKPTEFLKDDLIKENK